VQGHGINEMDRVTHFREGKSVYTGGAADVENARRRRRQKAAEKV